MKELLVMAIFAAIVAVIAAALCVFAPVVNP